MSPAGAKVLGKRERDDAKMDEDDGDNLPPEPPVPSEKALGKRKAVEKARDCERSLIQSLRLVANIYISF